MQAEKHDTQGSPVSILLIPFQSAISNYSFSIVLTIHLSLVHLVLVSACVYASLFPHTAKALLLIAGALGQPAPFKAFLCSIAHSTKNFMGEFSLQLLKLPILKLSLRLATLQFHWPSSGDFCKCQLTLNPPQRLQLLLALYPGCFCAVIHSDVSCLFLTSHRLTNQKMPWGQCARARMDSENGMLGQQRRAADEKEAE